MCAFVILASSLTPLPVWPVIPSVATALQPEARIVRLVQVAHSRWTVQLSASLPVPLALTSHQECAMPATQLAQSALPVILTTALPALLPITSG